MRHLTETVAYSKACCAEISVFTAVLNPATAGNVADEITKLMVVQGEARARDLERTRFGRDLD